MWPLINANQKIKYNLDIGASSKWVSAAPGAMARGTFFFVQEAGHFHCGPDYFTERESLQSFLIKCTLSGRGQVEYRGKTHDLCRGDVFFLKCDEYQCYRTSGESWEQIWIHFSGAGANGCFQQFYQAAGSCVVHLSHPDVFADAAARIIELYHVGGVYADIMANKYISDILTQLMVEAVGTNNSAALLPDSVQRAVELIERHYNQRITLEYLADNISLNKQYLQKLFKKHIGMSPYDHLTSIRINRAKELLRFSKMQVDDIAAAVGLENTSHFIRIFKGITGTTPNIYRKMWSSVRK